MERIYEECIDYLNASKRVNLADDRFVNLFSGCNSCNQSTCGEQVESGNNLTRDYLAQEKVFFETQRIDLIPQPYLFSSELIKEIELKFAELHTIVETVFEAYSRSKDIRDFLNLPPIIKELIQIECHSRPFAFLCRYDFTLTPDGKPKVYELNCAAPAAFVFSRHFFDAITISGHLKWLQSRMPFEIVPFSNQRECLFIRALADIARAKTTSDTRCDDRKINIGIINSKHNTMVNELSAMEAEGTKQGYKVIRAYLEDLSFKNNKLLAEDAPLDIVFGKFDNRPADDYEIPITKYRRDAEALLNGISSGVPFVNSFVSSWLLDNKSILALLHSRLGNELLTSSQRDLVHEIIPNTRLVNQLDAVELDECLENKGDYVLKKSLDTRGRSVTVGQEVNATEWAAGLKNARQDRFANYVIQGYEPPEASMSGGQKMFTSHAYFLLQGIPSGAFTRAARSNITNVGHGGAVQVPLIVRLERMKQ